jgi:co-chaperonin GroES (HSP10)
MKTLDLFVVELEKQLKDTIKTDSGFELYVDPKFKDFEHRVTDGPVVCSPLRHDTGVKEGDTLYFHHLVVLNEGQVLTGEDKHFLVRYDPEYTVNNQAIAYKCQETGDIQPLAGWSLLEHVEEVDPSVQSDIIETVSLKEGTVTKARVAFMAPWLEELGLKVGDIVGIKRDMDYKIIIDDKPYYRVRAEDLLYVEEEVHND